MDERTQVNVRVAESEKEKWDDHVEQEPMIPSISHLIRFAVNNEINNERGESGDGGGVSVHDVVDGVSDELHSDLHGLQEKIEAVQRGVRDVQEDVSPKEVWYLEVPAYHCLPTEEKGTESWENKMAGDPLSNTGHTVMEGTVTAISEYMHCPRHQAEQQLERLFENADNVHRKTLDDGTHYYWRSD